MVTPYFFQIKDKSMLLKSHRTLCLKFIPEAVSQNVTVAIVAYWILK